MTQAKPLSGRAIGSSLSSQIIAIRFMKPIPPELARRSLSNPGQRQEDATLCRPPVAPQIRRTLILSGRCERLIRPSVKRPNLARAYCADCLSIFAYLKTPKAFGSQWFIELTGLWSEPGLARTLFRFSVSASFHFPALERRPCLALAPPRHLSNGWFGETASMIAALRRPANTANFSDLLKVRFVRRADI